MESKKFKSGEKVEKIIRNKNTAYKISSNSKELVQEENTNFYTDLETKLNNYSLTIKELTTEIQNKYPINKHKELVKEYVNLLYQYQLVSKLIENMDKELANRRITSDLIIKNAKESGQKRTSTSKRDKKKLIRINELKDLLKKFKTKHKREMTFKEFKSLYPVLTEKFHVSDNTLKNDWHYNYIR